MTVHQAFMLGIAVGLVLAILIAFSICVRYIESDRERFLKWLDREGTP